MIKSSSGSSMSDTVSSMPNHSSFSIDSIKSYLADYTVWLPEFIIYGGVGFLVGFLLRNFGRIIISVCAVVLITLIVLQYTGMMTTSLPDMFGFSGISTIQEGVDVGVFWVKTHVMGFIGFLLGFSLGFKLS